MAEEPILSISFDKRQVSSLAIIQDLYEGAKAALRGESLVKLAVAVQILEAASDESDRLQPVKDRASEMCFMAWGIRPEGIDIDGDAFTYHNGDDGYWVQTWLWVDGTEVGDRDPNDIINEES